MAKIKQQQFLKLVALDSGKSYNTVKKSFDNIMNRLLNELKRGNNVEIDELGIFKSIVTGDYMRAGKYIDPREVPVLATTDKAQTAFNNKPINKINKTNLRDKKVKTMNSLGEARNKKDLYEMFENIKQEIANKEDNNDTECKQDDE